MVCVADISVITSTSVPCYEAVFSVFVRVLFITSAAVVSHVRYRSSHRRLVIVFIGVQLIDVFFYFVSYLSISLFFCLLLLSLLLVIFVV